jgi:hypothetical protein
MIICYASTRWWFNVPCYWEGGWNHSCFGSFFTTCGQTIITHH